MSEHSTTKCCRQPKGGHCYENLKNYIVSLELMHLCFVKEKFPRMFGHHSNLTLTPPHLKLHNAIHTANSPKLQEFKRGADKSH
jgi:hypothetical protein